MAPGRLHYSDCPLATTISLALLRFHTHLHSKNTIMAGIKPAWIMVMQNSIFVLAGPGRLWQRANSSWYCGFQKDLVHGCRRSVGIDLKSRKETNRLLINPRRFAAMSIYKSPMKNTKMYWRTPKGCEAEIPSSREDIGKAEKQLRVVGMVVILSISSVLMDRPQSVEQRHFDVVCQ